MIRFNFNSICAINQQLCELYNEPFSVNQNLLLSALSVYDSYFDTDELILCALIRSILRNHCFENGNKRTALLLIVLSDLSIKIEYSELTDLILDIINQHLTVEEIYKRLF